MNNRFQIQIKHNDQLDNESFDNLNPASQCGLSSACMVMSRFIQSAESDVFLQSFLYEFDKVYLTDKTKKAPRKSAILTNYPNEIDKYLRGYHVNKKTQIKPYGGTEKDVKYALGIGSPVMVATMLTSHGHYIVIIGYDDDSKCWIVHDPYGKFSFDKGRYDKIGKGSGASQLYPYIGLNVAMEKSSRLVSGNTHGGFRMLWIE